MKPTTCILLALLIFSCGDECDDAVLDYEHAEAQHVEKQKEADRLSVLLDDIDFEDPDQITSHQQIEDEYMFVLIDIAFLEIQMEDLKKQKFRCF